MNETWKDERILAVVSRLRDAFGADEIHIVDHWPSDGLAIGVARRGAPGVLAYLSVSDRGDWFIALESPPSPAEVSSGLPYHDVASHSGLGIEDVVAFVGRHLFGGVQTAARPSAELSHPTNRFPNNAITRQFIASHFRRRRVALSENSLLRAIASPRSKYDVYWGVLALRDVGTARSIPVLKGLLHYPMQDVKDCSILTIAHIAGPSETPFYLAALADKRTKPLYPMWAIEVAADGRAVQDVMNFVRVALRKANRPKAVDPGDAYISGLRFLARIGVAREVVEETLTLLRSAWARLPEGHRQTLRVALPDMDLPEEPPIGTDCDGADR